MENAQGGQIDTSFGPPEEEICLQNFTEESPISEPMIDPVQYNSEESNQAGRPEPPIDPLLEDANVKQAFASPTEAYSVGSDHTEDLRRQAVRNGLWHTQPEGETTCLENELPRSISNLSGQTMTSLVDGTKSSPKPIVTGEASERGKTTKRATTLVADAEVRHAVTAELKKAQMMKVAGSSNPSQGSPGSLFSPPPDMSSITAVSLEDVQRASLSRMPSILDGCTPSPKEDSGSLLIDEVLEAIKKAGYVIKKEPKSIGAVGNSQSGPSTKKVENFVSCDLCPKFKGRPCELKYYFVG